MNQMILLIRSGRNVVFTKRGRQGKHIVSRRASDALLSKVRLNDPVHLRSFFGQYLDRFPLEKKSVNRSRGIIA